VKTRMAHAPTPGHYAHVASAARTDSVVLDEYNGLPTLLVLEIDEVPVLAWMIHGAGGEYQLWLYIPLTGEELSDLYASDLTMLAEWVTRLAGRDSFVGLAADSVLILTTPWLVPEGEAGDLLGAALDAVARELKRSLASDLPEKTGRELRRVPLGHRPLADVC